MVELGRISNSSEILCLATGTQNSDKASLSISPAGRGQLLKMLITLEPHGLF